MRTGAQSDSGGSDAWDAIVIVLVVVTWKVFFFETNTLLGKIPNNSRETKNQREGINTLNDPAAKQLLNLDPDLRD